MTWQKQQLYKTCQKLHTQRTGLLQTIVAYRFLKIGEQVEKYREARLFYG